MNLHYITTYNQEFKKINCTVAFRRSPYTQWNANSCLLWTHISLSFAIRIVLLMDCGQFHMSIVRHHLMALNIVKSGSLCRIRWLWCVEIISGLLGLHANDSMTDQKGQGPVNPWQSSIAQCYAMFWFVGPDSKKHLIKNQAFDFWCFLCCVFYVFDKHIISYWRPLLRAPCYIHNYLSLFADFS